MVFISLVQSSLFQVGEMRQLIHAQVMGIEGVSRQFMCLTLPPLSSVKDRFFNSGLRLQFQLYFTRVFTIQSQLSLVLIKNKVL